MTSRAAARSRLVELLEATDEARRHQALEEAIAGLGQDELARECDALDAWRRGSDNLYQRVRALFFLYAVHRFHLRPGARGRIPARGVELLLARRFDEAIDAFLAGQRAHGNSLSDAVSSALAAAYRGLGFQTLADQVRRSVRSTAGNRWMFRCGHPLDHPLALRPELLRRDANGARPRLIERTPVRMDLSHSGWSDIFFLGMDFPEGARVLNVSIDLGVRGRDAAPAPPVECSLRVIDRPVLRLASVDLGASAEITELAELFDFARDHLGLLKAAVLASGLVPPGMEGSGASLRDVLARLTKSGACGIEFTSHVRSIPKGSRLAVSTTLLGSLIAIAMRATGQAAALAGPLAEHERRTVAARAILGEWLGGSGGGWQDSGGLWPGLKLIEGVAAAAGDPELGASRGRLLPRHTLLDEQAAPAAARAALQRSLVLVHGGMAQNVGPILEMVTEKYLLRSAREWAARREALGLMDELLLALRGADVPALARATTRNFFGPITTIIPQATNHFTETVIERVRARFGADFLGFWMLGGMSGGGMGFIFAPQAKAAALAAMGEILSTTKRELEHALPFAMEPVVYDFAINDVGTTSELEAGGAAAPDRESVTAPRAPASPRAAPPPAVARQGGDALRELNELLGRHGFDREWHEQVRRDLQSGRIGLAQNRLPASTTIEDVQAGDVADFTRGSPDSSRERGAAALAAGQVAIVTLAAGAASRWTGGAGVVKALSPFWKVAGRHRSFLDVHLAKSRRRALHGAALPHVFTTSLFTHAAIESALTRGGDAALAPGADVPSRGSFAHDDRTPPEVRRKWAKDPRDGTSTDVRKTWDECPRDGTSALLSAGRAVGLRLVPMERDLRFAFEQGTQQVLDERAQKVRESLQAAWIEWARATGPGHDYVDNVPLQCLHPVGHWYELPNLLRNGTLARLLAQRPQLTTLMLHNVDTVGADADPGLLGFHLEQAASGAALTFEVIARQIDDRGGGLARVDGRPRLVEGLTLPREELELNLTYYNTMTTWIDVDAFLRLFGLARTDLHVAPTPAQDERIAAAIRRVAAHLPTYVTLKEVKKRWGRGQEDVFPVTQFEKLWSDMTGLPGCECRFAVVPRARGQQLKEPAQLDGWLRDGSADFVATLCDW